MIFLFGRYFAFSSCRVKTHDVTQNDVVIVASSRYGSNNRFTQTIDILL